MKLVLVDRFGVIIASVPLTPQKASEVKQAIPRLDHLDVREEETAPK